MTCLTPGCTNEFTRKRHSTRCYCDACGRKLKLIKFTPDIISPHHPPIYDHGKGKWK